MLEKEYQLIESMREDVALQERVFPLCETYSLKRAMRDDTSWIHDTNKAEQQDESRSDVSSSSGVSKRSKRKAYIQHMQKLWKLYRRRMRRERKAAIEEELRNDSLIQKLEQENEGGCVLDESLFVVNSEDDDSSQDFELVLGGLAQCAPICKMKDSKVCYSDDDDSSICTESTTDETRSIISTSDASWCSWKSAETAKVNNRDETRAVLLRHYGGEDDSPWLAARRGDLDTLERRWKHEHDWTEEDEYGNTPLYYACSDGATKNLRVVLFMLQVWPSTEHIPTALTARCLDDAANVYVQEILLNPCHAELIIRDYEGREKRTCGDGGRVCMMGQSPNEESCDPLYSICEDKEY